MNREELLDLIPAYVLGALDADEASAVADLLRHDAEAQRLHADYVRVADALLYAVPVLPLPDRLRDGLRGRVADDAPVSSRPAVALTAPTSAAVKPARRVVTWLPALAVAALVLLFGALALSRQSTLAPDALYQQIIADAAAVRVPLDSGDLSAVSGELVYLPGEELAVIRAENLPSLTREQILQLWLVWPNDTLLNGGLFRPGANNDLYVRVPLDRAITDFVRLGFSLEPAAGSPYPDRPTGPRVFSANIVG